MKHVVVRICVIVDVDGEPARAQFTRQPTEEDLAAFRDVVRAARALVRKGAEE